MKLIIGLGNPGKEYERTRHNVGFSLVDDVAAKWGVSLAKQKFSAFFGEGQVGGQKVGLMKPQTFMNLSGQAVAEAVKFFGIAVADLLVIHDDLDLSLGRVKVDFDRGAAGHRGVESIMEALGREFYRVRMGIGRPTQKGDVENYVLSPFLAEELCQVDQMITEGMERVREWIKS